MGKFSGAVLVPQHISVHELEAYVIELLSPLQSADAIGGACSCKERAAASDARDAADRAFGHDRKRYDAFVRAFPAYRDTPYKRWREPRGKSPDYLEALARHERPWQACLEQALAANLASYRPDPACPACHGAGRLASSPGHEGPFDSFWLDRQRPPTPVRELAGDDPPFALFLPDGRYAISDEEATWRGLAPSWPAAVRELLAPHHDATLVWLGFHG